MSPQHPTHDSHDRDKCIRLAERLSEYLDGELPEDMCRLVEDHFRDCSDCERFLASLRRTRDCAKLMPRLELSSEKLAELAARAGRAPDDSP